MEKKQSIIPEPEYLVIGTYTLVALFYCIFSTILFHFVVGSVFLTYVHLIATIVVGLNWILLKIFKNHRFATSTIILVGNLVVVSLFATGGWEKTGYLWPFAYLPYAFFLSSKKSSFYWVGLLFIGCLFVTIFGLLGYIPLPYSFAALFNFFASLVVFSFCMFVYQGARYNYENLYNLKTKEFESTVEQLEKSKAELRETLDKNKASQEELISKNKELEGTKKAVLNILDDLNEEKRRTEGDKLRDEALIQSIGDGVITTDEYGRITVINKPVEAILGYTKDELVGKWIIDAMKIVDENNKPISSENRAVTKALLTGQKVIESAKIIKRDGSMFIAGITVAPIMVGDKPLGAVEIIRDITKEKEVDRMKTEFISLASHQLRTPLSAMKWFLEMLLGGDVGTLTTEQKEIIKNVDLSNERMISLVNSLLNISRIESGRIIIEPEPTDVRELVSEIIAELKPKLDEKKISLILSVHQNLEKVNLDPKLIGEVYKNFLTNSIKYTPSGGEISIIISKKNYEIISQISDNGLGIPVSEQPRVFQKFYRGANIVKIETDGTGLGLYLVKAIIDSSGGKLWFKSEEGKGSTFWFSLPMSGMTAKKGEVRLNS